MTITTKEEWVSRCVCVSVGVGVGGVGVGFVWVG